MLLLLALSACAGTAETPPTEVPTSPTTIDNAVTLTTTTTPTTTTTSATTTSSTTTTTTVATSQATQPSATSVPTPSVSGLPFHASIEDVDAERLAHSYTDDCPITPEDVVMITVDYWGFDGNVHDGQIVVARAQGPAIVDVFHRLFDIRYPIYSMIPIGDLPKGIEDDDPTYNNTSGLHCRRATGSTRWSEHAKGLAIDINPFLNPFVTSSVLWPADSGKYLDRSLGEPGMIIGGDEVVEAFRTNGWYWGGYWKSIKDYQHFSTSGR